MTYRLELDPRAEADLDEILEWSVSRFGASVRDGYEVLIIETLSAITRDPGFAGSQERDDLGRGVRTVHLRTCRDQVSHTVRRITSPRHFVVYRQVGDVIQVARLLHDAMDMRAGRIPE